MTECSSAGVDEGRSFGDVERNGGRCAGGVIGGPVVGGDDDVIPGAKFGGRVGNGAVGRNESGAEFTGAFKKAYRAGVDVGG